MLKSPKSDLKIDGGFLRRNGICGTMLSAAKASDLKKINSLGIPCVLFSSAFPDIPVERVLIDRKKATFTALKHLHDLGHRRIAIFNLHSTLNFQEIAAEVFDCLPEEDLVDVIKVPGYGFINTEKAFEDYQRLRKKPTAAVFMDDIAFMDPDAKEKIIRDFILPAALQMRNHYIGLTNQQDVVNYAILYAGLVTRNWPLVGFAYASEHGVLGMLRWKGLSLTMNWNTHIFRNARDRQDRPAPYGIRV